MIRLLLLLATVPFLISSSASAEDVSRPNVVFFLIDDMGWTDLGCFGSSWYETPTIDALCASGMKFTNAYSNGPNCAPTRACLMSGQYTPRHGIYTVDSGARGKASDRLLIPAPNKKVLADDVTTLAEVLTGSGYRCAHFGKWHLGDPPAAGPKQQGFDVNIGGNQTGSPRGGYFGPWNNKQMPAGKKGEYLTDRLSSEASDFLRNHHKNNAGQPFFMYMAHYAVHTPIQAKESDKNYFASKPTTGKHNNPAYAAMVRSVDESVELITRTLAELKLDSNTIVIFTSDNGGLGGYASVGLKKNGNVTDNAPLKGGKGCLYEGGIRVPAFVVWPGVTKAGSICDVPIMSADFYPTLAEIAVAKTNENQPLDGKSIVPLLKGEDVLADRAIFWHFPGYLQAYGPRAWRTTPGSVIREGDYKLIEYFEDGRLELYNLKNDLSERNNLAETEADRTKALHQKLKNWRKDINAPLPTPKK